MVQLVAAPELVEHHASNAQCVHGNDGFIRAKRQRHVQLRVHDVQRAAAGQARGVHRAHAAFALRQEP